MEIVRHLYDSGADIEAIDDEGNTPLHIAVKRGHFDIVKYLIERGSQTETQDLCGNTPLNDAISIGHSEIYKYLTDHGADINLETYKAAMFNNFFTSGTIKSKKWGYPA